MIMRNALFCVFSGIASMFGSEVGLIVAAAFTPFGREEPGWGELAKV